MVFARAAGGALIRGDKRSFLARWRTPLQVLFAIAALTFVLTRIPWHDVLVLKTGKQQSELEGELRGDWKSERVEFRPLEAEGASAAPLAALPRDGAGFFSLTRGSTEASSIDWRPGMLRVFREMDRSALALALGLFVVGQLIVVTRWWRLLAAGGLAVPWSESLRLTGLGLFFNLVVPGLTGGDLVKAVLAARAHPGKSHAAFVSIAFDRLLGLLCMAVLAAVAVLVAGEVFADIRTAVVACAGAGVVLAVATLSRGLRRAIGLEKLFARLPLAGTIQKLDEAVLTYSARPLELALCVLLSFLNHLCMISGILVLGRAFGDTLLSWPSYFAVAPVATIISAIPIAPGGWGVRELAYSSLFTMLGGSAAIGLAVSVSFGLLQTAISLACGAFMFTRGGTRLSELKDLRETPA